MATRELSGRFLSPSQASGLKAFTILGRKPPLVLWFLQYCVRERTQEPSIAKVGTGRDASDAYPSQFYFRDTRKVYYTMYNVSVPQEYVGTA